VVTLCSSITIVNMVTTQSSGSSDPDNTTRWTTNGSVATQTTETATTTYGQLMAFCQWYQAVHGYVCIVVCVFGIAANVMNIIVLTRRNMVRRSALFMDA